MTATEERRLKGLLKSAVIEVLEERPDLLRGALAESLEDFALLRAIKAGKTRRKPAARGCFGNWSAACEGRIPGALRAGLGGDHGRRVAEAHPEDD